MRSLVTLFAVLALFLAFGPGAGAHETGTVPATGNAVASAPMDGEGCAPLKAAHGEAKRHGAAGHATCCCVGAVCVSAGLPPAAIAMTPPINTVVDPSVAGIFPTGRDVDPPLDPPRRVV